jgi:hypothetical protein
VFTFFGFISKFNRHFSLSVVNNLKNKSGKSHGNPAKFSQPPDERVNGLAGANVRSPFAGETNNMFGWLVADGGCWFVLREEYCWLVADGWFVVREKYCWPVADKPSEQPCSTSLIFPITSAYLN